MIMATNRIVAVKAAATQVILQGEKILLFTEATTIKTHKATGMTITNRIAAVRAPLTRTKDRKAMA